jgi:hypothetical protein
MLIKSSGSGAGFGVFDDNTCGRVESKLLAEKVDHLQRLVACRRFGGRYDPMPDREACCVHSGVRREIGYIGFCPANDLDGVVLVAAKQVLAESPDGGSRYANRLNDHLMTRK